MAALSPVGVEVGRWWLAVRWVVVLGCPVEVAVKGRRWVRCMSGDMAYGTVTSQSACGHTHAHALVHSTIKGYTSGNTHCERGKSFL